MAFLTIAGVALHQALLMDELSIANLKTNIASNFEVQINVGEFNYKDENIRLLATKELSKYVFATKKQTESSFNIRSLEDIICENQDLISENKMIDD